MSDAAYSPPILELLHPLGHARNARVLGRASGAVSSLWGPGAYDPHTPADLIIIAPDAAELAAQGWLEQTVEDAAGSLRPGGLLYVLARRSVHGKLKALLEGCGLSISETLLHHPSWQDAQTLVPLTRPGLRYAFTRLIRTHPGRRKVALALLDLPGALRVVTRLMPSTGLLARRPGSPAPAAWLLDAIRPEASGSSSGAASVVLHTSWRGRAGAVLLHAVDRAGEPVAIAKTWFGPNGEEGVAREADALVRLAAAAAGFGAQVPALLRRGHHAGRPFLVESAVTGERASVWLQADPARLPALLTRLADWLAAWTAAAVRPTVATKEMLEERLLRPADELAMEEGYRDWLRGLAARLEGAIIPLVPAHGDLAMVNVLVRETPDGFELGVIDWETATRAGLPLCDFCYAAVDAVAALADYRDRPAAFAKCFAPDGEHRPLIERLQTGLIEKLGLTPDQFRLSFHASWLAFALDERRERTKTMPDEFLRIARQVARGVDPALASAAGLETQA